MEALVPLLILALFIVVGLMFFERSRRADLRQEESLHRRVLGQASSTATRGEAASQEAKPPQVAYVPGFLRPLERWLAQAGLEMPVLQFLAFLRSRAWLAYCSPSCG
jgi:hypothetical protein